MVGIMDLWSCNKMLEDSVLPQKAQAARKGVFQVRQEVRLLLTTTRQLCTPVGGSSRASVLCTQTPILHIRLAILTLHIRTLLDHGLWHTTPFMKSRSQTVCYG
jgi:hypothetical protein